MIENPTEKQVARWRHVAAVMKDADSFRDAVNELAFGLHHVGEHLTAPADRLAYATGLTNRLFDRLSAAAVSEKLVLTADHVEEVTGALIIAALDMADVFPATGARS